MPFGRILWFACVAVVVAAAYAVYRPDIADRWTPQVAGAAHQWHDKIWPPAPQTAQGNGKAAGPRPVMVTVATATRGDFPVILQGLGQVQAFNTVTVRARVDGQIDKIAFQEGQMVKQGDLLAEIDPRPFRAALEQAQAKKVQDEANLANAKLDQARYATLAKQNFATQQQLDTQVSTVNQLTAAIAADSAAVDAAQVQLGYTMITAPIAGRVGYRLIDQGNMVSASQQTAIVTIAQLEPIAVVFTQPQEYVDKINAELKGGPLVTTVVDAQGETIATGKLIVTDNQVDLQSGTIKLKAEFQNEQHRLWPGLAVTVGLQIGDDKNVVLAPAQAVQHGQDGLYVYVIDQNQKAQVRQVKITDQNTKVAVVASGLEAGDKVVTSGSFMLEPGAPVTIQAAQGS